MGLYRVPGGCANVQILTEIPSVWYTLGRGEEGNGRQPKGERMATWTKEQVKEIAAYLVDKIDDELSDVIPEHMGLDAETDDDIDTAYDAAYEAIVNELVRQLKETKK